MGLLDGVHGERVGKVHAKVFECVNPLHSCVVDVEGGGIGSFLRKSKINSFIFFVFRIRLFSPHHRSSPLTSCL